jgi:hypothetical protein
MTFSEKCYKWIKRSPKNQFILASGIAVVSGALALGISSAFIEENQDIESKFTKTDPSLSWKVDDINEYLSPTGQKLLKSQLISDFLKNKPDLTLHVAVGVEVLDNTTETGTATEFNHCALNIKRNHFP